MGAPGPGELYVGLISGTSMDGIDAVVVDLSEPRPRLLSAMTRPFDQALRQTLEAVRAAPDDFPVARLGALDAVLGDRFAEAALQAIEAAGLDTHEIRAIGSHGQTIVHHPEATPPFSLQVGDAHRIARQTGIATVADFRRADLAAGGQGAPLAPLLHDALFRDARRSRAVINLGGIANVTVLQPGEPVRGFDTGPANCFLDGWYRRHHARGRFDENGAWVAGGAVDEAWLERLLEDPYFRQAPPKSTGIEYFSPGWLDARLPDWAASRPRDAQATLAEFSARTIAASLAACKPRPAEWIVCGGGAANADLLERLGARDPDATVMASDALGLPADHVEATLFAWLARERLAGRAMATESITGAGTRPLLGVVHAP